MKALLIEFDVITGRRAGNINPKIDRNLVCRGWQNLELNDVKSKGYISQAIPNCCLEIRVIEDDRDISQYQVEGITILNDESEINATLDKYFEQDRYSIQDPKLMEMHIQERGISLDELYQKETSEVLKMLYETYKIAGIIKRKRFDKIQVRK